MRILLFIFISWDFIFYMITAWTGMEKTLEKSMSKSRLHVSKSGCMIKLFHENRWLQSTGLCFPFHLLHLIHIKLSWLHSLHHEYTKVQSKYRPSIFQKVNSLWKTQWEYEEHWGYTNCCDSVHVPRTVRAVPVMGSKQEDWN